MTEKKKMSGIKNWTPFLWAGAGILAVCLLFARVVYPELLWLTVVVGVLLVADLGLLIAKNRQALRGRTAAYGMNSAVTILLVIGILVVINFLSVRYPGKLDLTKNKLHSLSDQTVKVVKDLKMPVKATLFAKVAQKEQTRPLLDNYKGLNPKFEVEYVDPDREPMRAKQAGIRKYGTLLLTAGTRESKIEEVTEEKLTNAMIKLLKEKNPTICSIIGHGERTFGANDAEGFEAVKKGLTDQSYEVKDVSLVQENKIPETCDSIAILGPIKAFLEAEAKLIREYLANGGRAVITYDLNIKGTEFSPELVSILETWHVKPVQALIIDPVSRIFGQDAAVPVVGLYSKDHSITKDFRAENQSLFPLVRPLDILPNAPEGLKVEWLGQTTATSWAVTDMKQLASGKVEFNPAKDKKGPLNVAVAVDGKLKDSKAPRNTRLVVFGSSQFATNKFARYGANIDFMLNAISWTLEDETMISIRTKEEGPGKVELSQKQGAAIGLVTVFIIPLLIAAGGIVVWFIRRRM